MPTKVTALTAVSSIVSGDLLYVIDVSDTSGGASGTSKKVTVGELLNSLGVGIRITGFDYTVYKASGNTDLSALEVGDRVEGVGAYFSGDYIIATVATVPVTTDANFNTPIYRNASI